ncbi:hypothetical protein ACHAWF_009869 [Thalassiosira exigua]
MLNEERIAMLDAIGFDWRSKRRRESTIDGTPSPSGEGGEDASQHNLGEGGKRHSNWTVKSFVDRVADLEEHKRTSACDHPSLQRDQQTISRSDSTGACACASARMEVRVDRPRNLARSRTAPATVEAIPVIACETATGATKRPPRSPPPRPFPSRGPPDPPSKPFDLIPVSMPPPISRSTFSSLRPASN